MSLQPLTEADLELILPWRNAPAERRATYSHHEITLGEHLDWFGRTQKNPTRRCYLYHDASGIPQGVVNFTDLNVAQGTAFWGFYARPEAPFGSGQQILVAALDLAFGDLRLHKLSGEVLADNTKSLYLHKQVGFTEEGRFREQHCNGKCRIDIIRLGLLAQEWREHRPGMLRRLVEMAALSAQGDAATPRRKILILSDADSWLNAHLHQLLMEWEAQGHSVSWFHDPSQADAGDFCFCLSLGQLVPESVRARFLHTLVVHESNLPQGKGWSPLTWQILAGQNHIPVTLLEAAERVDSGPIYAQRLLRFAGHELIEELHTAQAAATLELCRWFVDTYPRSAAEARSQEGDESFYPRRRPADSRLDPDKTLAEQFDLLRVVDNERYPAFFDRDGHSYRVIIERA